MSNNFGENRLGMKLSKWRQQMVEIKPGELKEVYFENTNPNMFFISNFNDMDIYGGLSRIPTAKKHEFIFKAHKQKPFGVPHGKRVLYLLNLSTETAEVDVYSTEMQFDLNVLHDFSVDNVTITADDPVSFELAGVNEGVELPVYNENVNIMKDDLKSVVSYLSLLLNNEHNAEGVGLIQLLNRLKNIDNGLIKLLSGEVAADSTNLRDVVQAIVEKETILNADNVTFNGTNLETVHANLSEIINLLNKNNLINNIPFNDTVYVDNLGAIYVPANHKKSILHFEWFYNDGADVTFMANQNPVLTVKKGEKLTNFNIELNGEYDFVVMSANNDDDTMMRAKYYLIPLE